MTDVKSAQAEARGRETSTSPVRRFVRRFSDQRFSVVMFVVLVTIVLVAVLAPVIAPSDPNLTELSMRLAPPSAEHLLGNDELGRDMVSRLMFGTSASLYAAVQAVLLAFFLGVPMGLASGYLGGRTDAVLMRINDAIMAFPALILAIAIVGFLGPSLQNAMIAIGVTYTPRFARVVRGATLSVKEETYIEAARSMGASKGFIVRRHVLPNILSPLVVQTTLTMGMAVLAEASLSFLGLGVQPPGASLGAILGRSFTYIDQAPLNVITPGICIMLLVLAFNVVGDGMRDSFGREVRRD